MTTEDAVNVGTDLVTEDTAESATPDIAGLRTGRRNVGIFLVFLNSGGGRKPLLFLCTATSTNYFAAPSLPRPAIPFRAQQVAEEQQEPEQYEEYNTEEFEECPEPIPVASDSVPEVEYYEDDVQ
ncbi:uncharacterized protein LOC112271627 [Brachypodium distachyon]|uniref:uncharacterized protein LOC112271627 n=1 Tax=Brachypodium distachyon TaxID=15368 RepID=UPI000D0CCA0B|nr:uncharacterized protein LOC112271627 [Brachypodium distachyon]|eukprot:XP_024317117.1 uncharacterized protein LOC112271627 [Brachypodium distachyon]